MITTKILPYSAVVARLLKGSVEYFDKTIWEELLLYKMELNAFLPQLGLQLVLNEEDGYACVKQMINDEDSTEVNWFQRRQFTYEESVLLVLLREMMAEFEVSESGAKELIKRRREIKEYAELFYKENASRVKFLREIDRLIERMDEYGFINLMEETDVKDDQKCRIKKIIKEKISMEVMDQFETAVKAKQEQIKAK